MTEFNLGTIAVGALAMCILDAFFWMWGGREGKWRRRFVGAGIQTAGLNAASILVGTWCWGFAASAIPEAVSRSLGYGGNTVAERVIKRSVFALGSLAVGALIGWSRGWGGSIGVLVSCQSVASIVSIILGVKNPLPAAVEEVFVCVSLKYINYAYIFVGVS